MSINQCARRRGSGRVNSECRTFTNFNNRHNFIDHLRHTLANKKTLDNVNVQNDDSQTNYNFN